MLRIHSNSNIGLQEPAGKIVALGEPPISWKDHVVGKVSTDAKENEEVERSVPMENTRPVRADQEEEEDWEVVGGTEEVEDWALIRDL